MRIGGHCHCGNIALTLDWPADSVEIPARACGCSFCTRHGAVWTAHPVAALRVEVRDARRVHRYAFETRTAEFLVCSDCGVVPVATSRVEGILYAVVNVNACDGLDPSLLARAPVSFDGESESARLARRRRNWIAQVEIRGAG